jgi:threonine/homoserine/homoserine lactone efflux protein
MSTLPIAANLPSGMFTPLVVLLAGYAVASVMAGMARTRENRPRAEKLSTIAFGLVLVAAAYVAVLLIASVVSYPNRIYDMLVILLVVGAFFALLLFLFFGISELLPRVFRRGRDR